MNARARCLVASMVAGFLGCQAILVLGQPEQAYAVIPEGTDARGPVDTGFDEVKAARDAEAAKGAPPIRPRPLSECRAI